MMNSTLPASIISYLKEAGFSPTEMLVLKKLVEEDSVTLRELSAKTGKSTGILDQMMKKLVAKKIARREVINGVPRFVVTSLDSVVQWMHEDMKERREMMERRHQDFASFVASLKHDKHRPNMEYFNGMEGIQQAYTKLLDSAQELLTFTPILTTAEDDPLRAFRVDYFRKRQCRKIFQRILASDTPLARRFQSRDMFEYRQTLLVPQSELPMTFERTIVDGVIACFNLQEQTACFLKYPELAAAERAQFETLWKKQLEAERHPAGDHQIPPEPTIPIKTRTLSRIREFLLSPRSFAAFLFFALLSGAITFGMYQANQELNFQRMRDKVSAIAATGVLQIDPKHIQELKREEDYKKPEWAKVVNVLKDIRTRNSDILYVYIFRQSAANSTILEFVADSHSLHPFANVDNDPSNDVDANGDGKIDGSPAGADLLQWPGQLYPDPTSNASRSFDGTIASTEFYEDQFGKVVSGYAPIKDQNDRTIAMLAVDIKADKLDEMTGNTFTPWAVFLLFFVLFTFIRLSAFNRSLLREICDLICMRRVMVTLAIAALISIGMTFGLYKYTQHLSLSRMKDKVLAIATTGALQIDAGDLDQLRQESDYQKPEWIRVNKLLRDIQFRNTNIMYVYIVRKTQADSHAMEFVADPLSINPYANIDADPDNDVEMNGDGKIDGSPTGGDYLAWPGQPYPTAPEEAFDGYNGPTTNKNFYEDQWGRMISGYAPIKDESGTTVAVLAVDINSNELNHLTYKTFFPVYIFLALFLCFVVVRVVAY